MATMCVVNVHKSTKVTKAKVHTAHRNVFLINFFTFSTHRPSSNCWSVQWTCAASFYGWRYFCCYCDTHAFLQKSMRRHMKDVHHSSHLFKCNICRRKFQTNARLEEHCTKKHVANEISFHQCTYCEYKTMNRYYFNQHVKRQHMGNNSVLCATNALCESQMNTFWRNTCSSTLNPSVLFVTRNSMQKRIWKGTWKHTKCKGVKIVENLLAVRNSSARTNKSTISKKIMTKRLI